MSGAQAIRVDEASGRIAWEESGEAREALVEGAVDARYDPGGGRLIVLTRAEERGAIVILSRDGEMIETLPPPEGYTMSHFASAGPVLVGQGEASDGGWWDWHFIVDEEGRALHRLGPAH